MHGFDFIEHAHFARRTVRILILARVLLGKLVDEFVGAFFSDLHHAAANRKMAIWIVWIEDVDADPWIAPDVFVLDASYGGIDQNVLAIVVEPDRSYVRTAVRHQCRQLSERL